MPGLSPRNYLTLSDVAKMTHNGELVPMVDELTYPTSLFAWMKWKQASDTMRDVSAKLTALPKSQWVGLDMGVKASKGNWTQKEEGLAMAESWAEINEKTYMKSAHKEATRWENDQVHIQGLGMDAEEGLVYGNPLADPNQPLGFIARFGKVTDHHRMAGGAKYDYCTLSAGGSTANKQSSILVLSQGPMAPFLLYPRYQEENGLLYRHWGFENDKDENGGNIRVAKSQFQITFGLSIKDTRTAVRIANVETTNTTSIGNVRDAMFEAVEAIPKIYRNSIEVFTTSDVILALRKNYAGLVNPVTYDPNGLGHNSRGDIMFDGIVFHECSSMLNTEAVVS